MHWVYLSPHLDDVVLSCGGMVWEQVSEGDQVEVWTICAGDPPEDALNPFALSLHQRWQTDRDAIATRRKEDIQACERLGVNARHFPFLDCIYRRFPEDNAPVIRKNEDLFQPLDRREEYLVGEVQSFLQAHLPENAFLVIPLTIGGHIDHRLTRRAGTGLVHKYYNYAEYPYVLNEGEKVSHFIHNNWKEYIRPISEEGLEVWQDAVLLYESQISTFWINVEEMRKSIRNYWQQGGGSKIWFSPQDHQ